MRHYNVEKIHAQIRHNVKVLHKKRGKSQLEMALAIGHSSAGFYTKAELVIPCRTFVQIANDLDVDIRDFFDGIKKE